MTILTKISDLIEHAQALADDVKIPYGARSKADLFAIDMTHTAQTLAKIVELVTDEVHAELGAQKEDATPATTETAGEATPAADPAAGEPAPATTDLAGDPTPAAGDAAPASVASAATATDTAPADPAPAEQAAAVDPMAVAPATVDHSPAPASVAEPGSAQ